MSLEQDTIEKLQAILDEYRDKKDLELESMWQEKAKEYGFAQGDIVLYDNPRSRLFPAPSMVKILEPVEGRTVRVQGVTNSGLRVQAAIEFLKKVNP